MNKQLIITLAWLSAISFYLFFSWEWILNFTDHNIYRVLDSSIIDLTSIVILLAIQFILLKKTPRLFENIRTIASPIKKSFPSLLGSLFLFSIIFSLLPFQHNAFVFILCFIVLGLFSALYKIFSFSYVKRSILLILFCSTINATFIFWMHESENEDKHIKYASLLAESRDTIAEAELTKLIELGRITSSNSDIAQEELWEKLWVSNSYLASNYQFEFKEKNADIFQSKFQPTLTNPDFKPTYKIALSNENIITFQLKTDNWRSVYTENEPYKRLKKLRDYNYAVVKNSNIIHANSHDFDLNISEIELPPVGTLKKIEINNYDAKVYRNKANEFVIIGEPLSEFQVWISNFAFFFVLLIAITVLVELVNLCIIEQNLMLYWQKLPLQNRIQTVIMSLTCLLFFIIASTTFIFLRQNNFKVSHERQIYIAETLREEIIEESEQYGWALKDFKSSLLAELANRKLCDIDFYSTDGNLIVSSIASQKNSLAPKAIDANTKNIILKNPKTIYVKKLKKNNENIFRTSFGISIDGRQMGIVAINAFESEIGSAQDIPVIMSKMLNVYVLLLLITWGTGMLLINLLTQPLVLLADRLGSFNIGKQNLKLKWQGKDAIGKLISKYNVMVDKVEEMTNELIRNEREGAWQIMAQQIAHEINNSLTPLRLNVQFLTRVMETDQKTDIESAKRITNSLVEKIDDLSGIARQFQLFAKLDSPNIQPVELKSFLNDFISSYHQTDFSIEVKSEINGSNPHINIDPQHLQEVLKNIINNSKDAIQNKDDGLIKCKLKMNAQHAIVEIMDNGNCVESYTTNNVFDPNFSITSSLNGLGLPICKRIVEYYNGELKFQSLNGKGNQLVVCLPLLES